MPSYQRNHQTTKHLGILDEARTVKSYHRQVLVERSACKDAIRIGEKQAEQKSMMNRSSANLNNT
jgi:hypothetical protein